MHWTGHNPTLPNADRFRFQELGFALCRLTEAGIEVFGRVFLWLTLLFLLSLGRGYLLRRQLRVVLGLGIFPGFAGRRTTRSTHRDLRLQPQHDLSDQGSPGECRLL